MRWRVLLVGGLLGVLVGMVAVLLAIAGYVPDWIGWKVLLVVSAAVLFVISFAAPTDVLRRRS